MYVSTYMYGIRLHSFWIVHTYVSRDSTIVYKEGCQCSTTHTAILPHGDKPSSSKSANWYMMNMHCVSWPLPPRPLSHALRSMYGTYEYQHMDAPAADPTASPPTLLIGIPGHLTICGQTYHIAHGRKRQIQNSGTRTFRIDLLKSITNFKIDREDTARIFTSYAN